MYKYPRPIAGVLALSYTLIAFFLVASPACAAGNYLLGAGDLIQNTGFDEDRSHYRGSCWR